MLGLLTLVTACTQQETASADTETTAVDPVAPADARDDATASTESATAPVVIPGTAAAPVYREFREFVVACDNIRHCDVIGVTDAASGLVLSLHRDAGVAGAHSLVLRAPWRTLDAQTLRLDGARAGDITALPWRHASGETEALHLDDPVAIARFIDLVRDGARLEAGADRVLSLSGLSAALLFVDAQQQRLDSAGAWLRRGTRADSDVPAAPPLPDLPSPPAAPPALDPARAESLIRHVRATQAAVLDTQDCEPAGGAYDIARYDTAVALDDSQALVLLGCYSGAYQHSSVPFRAALEGGTVEALTLPGPPMTQDSVQLGEFDLLTSPGYNASSGLLTTHAKGRGIGDCGFYADWRFDGQAFALARFGQMNQCGGLAPDDWPVLWRVAGSFDPP